MQQEALQRSRQARARLAGAARIRLQDRHVDLGKAASREGQQARPRVVQHGSQREHIGGRGDVLAAHLLGRHVQHRAHQHAHLCDAHFVLGARDAEVEQLHSAIGQHHDVAGLEIAVNHAFFVHMCQGARHRQSDAHAFFDPEHLLLQDLVERAPFEVLHRDVGGPLVAPVLVYDGDVFVLEVRGLARLTQEAIVSSRIDLDMRAQDLQSHGAAQPRVDGAVDLRLRPVTELVGGGLELEVGEAHDACDASLARGALATPDLGNQRSREIVTHGAQEARRRTGSAGRACAIR